MKKYITALFTFLVVVSANAQTSFRQYTSEVNEKIAFADGIEINEGYGNTLYEF